MAVVKLEKLCSELHLQNLDKIFLNGKEIEIKSVKDAMTNEIGYVPEDRLTQGLFMERSIQDNVIAASIRKYMKGGKLDEKEMENTTNHWIKEIEIKAPSPKPAVRTLPAVMHRRSLLQNG